MNKSYILTALGVVGSSLLTINANADTIYMCKTCKAGTYANNNKCETCPAGSYCIDGVKKSCASGTYSTGGASSCNTCTSGNYVFYGPTGSSACYSCSAGNYCNGSYQYSCPDRQYQNETGKSSCKACDDSPVTFNYNLSYSHYTKHTNDGKTCMGTAYSGNASGSFQGPKMGEQLLFSNIKLYTNSDMCNSLTLHIKEPDISISFSDKYKYIYSTIERSSCNKVTGKSTYTIKSSGEIVETFEY